MVGKRGWIVLLAGINVLLMLALVFSTYSPAKAMAQPGGRAGSFIGVTSQAGGQSYEVLYLLDIQERKLHALIPPMGKGSPEYAGFRDLKDDFK